MPHADAAYRIGARDALNPMDFRRAMQHLAVAFGGKRDLEEKADLYFDQLRDLPAAAVEAAVQRAIREESGYFPKIAQLRHFAQDWQRRQVAGRTIGGAWSGFDDDGNVVPCPVCGAVHALRRQEVGPPDRLTGVRATGERWHINHLPAPHLQAEGRGRGMVDDTPLRRTA